MVSDLLKILQAIQSAQSDEEKRRLESEFAQAVHAHIRDFYDDPRYPRRRRSFAAIRKSLQIYNDKESDLRDVLYAMGGRAVKGDGEDALWELPENPGTPMPDPPPRAVWSQVYVALAAIAVLVAGGGWFLGLYGSGEPPICNLAELNLRELERCEEDGGVVR